MTLPDKVEIEESRRYHAIERAEKAADTIIYQAAEGDPVLLNYLTAKLSERFATKVLAAHAAMLLKKDLGL